MRDETKGRKAKAQRLVLLRSRDLCSLDSNHILVLLAFFARPYTIVSSHSFRVLSEKNTDRSLILSLFLARSLSLPSFLPPSFPQPAMSQPASAHQSQQSLEEDHQRLSADYQLLLKQTESWRRIAKSALRALRSKDLAADQALLPEGIWILFKDKENFDEALFYSDETSIGEDWNTSVLHDDVWLFVKASSGLHSSFSPSSLPDQLSSSRCSRPLLLDDLTITSPPTFYQHPCSATISRGRRLGKGRATRRKPTSPFDEPSLSISSSSSASNAISLPSETSFRPASRA